MNAQKINSQNLQQNPQNQNLQQNPQNQHLQKYQIGRINSFESMGTVDGPGIRFVIFMQGCLLRCKYCHNPDTWEAEGGGEYSTLYVAEQVEKYKSYMKNGGGASISGGEPLLQIDFVSELFALLKERGIHTALDTSGFTFNAHNAHIVEKHEKLLAHTDLVLLDIKQVDEQKHIALTGHSNKNPLDFALFLSEKKIPTWIRYVLVPGLTDDEQDLSHTRRFIDKLKNVEKIEVLPYHSMGEVKYERLGLKYPLHGTESPSPEQVAHAKKMLGC